MEEVSSSGLCISDLLSSILAHRYFGTPVPTESHRDELELPLDKSA